MHFLYPTLAESFPAVIGRRWSHALLNKSDYKEILKMHESILIWWELVQTVF